MVAVVGRTGAGKTTLASLVPRFLDPGHGRVLIDGFDIRDFTLASLRRNIAIVAQDVFLFPRTVAENIAYGRPGATMQEIEDAARLAQADDFIRELPAGYETVLGERGASLSGGERQRIAIARAFLTGAPVLILDEITSALDTRTEMLLVKALAELTRNRTVLVIAHRLSTVRNADKVVVLEHGRIVEYGPPEELLARGGRFSRFHVIQSGLRADERKAGGAAG
jgi:ABC-type multidrug transport system fused ATPase/permease subunit